MRTATPWRGSCSPARLSATPIPGNEKLVAKTIDNLLKLGANVIYGRNKGIHVSGHASQEELKLMHNLVRPKFFIPVHGEYHHLVQHAKLARELGMPKDHIFIAENGSVLEFIVRYTDDTGIAVGTLDSSDVVVAGPNGFTETAGFVAIQNSTGTISAIS